MAVVFLFIITTYHMLSAIYINQILAVIKFVNYLMIALAEISKLISNSDSRINWKHSLNGTADITAYSTSILAVNMYTFFSFW